MSFIRSKFAARALLTVDQWIAIFVAVADELDMPDKRGAVICAAGRLASVRDTIASMPLPDELRNRLTVLTALQVKGLEFDAVLVVFTAVVTVLALVLRQACGW